MNPYLAFFLIGPIVFLIVWTFSIWPFWQTSRDEKNLAEAEKDLPALAKRLKLRHKKGDGLGSYSGFWNRHKVRVDPQHFMTTVGILLREDPKFYALHRGVAEKAPFDLAWVAACLGKMMKIEGGPAGDGPRFDFGDPVLDKYFQTRQLLDGKAEPLVRDLAVRMVLRDFLDGNRRAVKNLSIGIGAEVSCSLWVGCSTTKTRLRSVTGKQASLMLSEMMPIVEAIEKAMGFTEGKRPAGIEPI